MRKWRWRELSHSSQAQNDSRRFSPRWVYLPKQMGSLSPRMGSLSLQFLLFPKPQSLLGAAVIHLSAQPERGVCGGGYCPGLEGVGVRVTALFAPECPCRASPCQRRKKKVRITAFPPAVSFLRGSRRAGGAALRGLHPCPPPGPPLPWFLLLVPLSPQWGSVVHRLLRSGAPRPRHGRRQRLMNFGVTRGLAGIWEPRALIRTHGPAPSKAQPFHPAADL